MHTLFDFITNVNAAQYGFSLFSILGFIVFYHILKPKPFKGLLESAADEARFIRTQDRGYILQIVRNIAMAPVYLMIYLVSLPLLFILGAVAPRATVMSGEWSPVRAYFMGSRKSRKSRGSKKG
ncbi:MAG: hypothetical protein HQL09_03860 [Nitrospirae bacterium]|nr:hypothetical protein [Nitrospirota bacterium]